MSPSTMSAESPCLCAGVGGGARGVCAGEGDAIHAWVCFWFLGALPDRSAVLSHVRSLPVHAWGSVKRKPMQNACSMSVNGPDARDVAERVTGVMRGCKESTSVPPALG